MAPARADRELELDAFVCFSSIAAIFGGGGQGAYAAANAFLDALAEHRRGQGLAATSIAWGAWAGEGMALGASTRLERQGIRELPPRAALGALREALEADAGCVVIADLDWERYALTYSSARARPLIAELPDAQRALREATGEGGTGDGMGSGEGVVTGTGVGTTGRGAGSEWAARLAGLPEHERERTALALVRERAAGVLGHTSLDSVPAERTFRELGFDSLAGVQLARGLRAATGLRLAPAAVFDHPTPAALAAHLLREATGERAAVRVAAPAVRELEQPVAIVGIGCRLAGGGRHGALAGGAVGAAGARRGCDRRRSPPTAAGIWRGCTTPTPTTPAPAMPARVASCVDAAEFDAGFFGIGAARGAGDGSAAAAAAGSVLGGAGGCRHRPAVAAREPDRRVRGRGRQRLHGRGRRHRGLDGYRLTGTLASVASGRVAYTLGLEGPAVSVDTACSSSLVALHWAAQSLRAGECTLALAGGVAVMAKPDAFVEFSRQRGLAPDGRCKSFADSADGTGWSEGAGILLLERLADARRHGHEVLGVLRGSAVNQDGASNGLTAPNGPSQQRVIMQALAAAGCRPGEVDAVEAHGTGTTLGDPIEAQALLATYGQGRAREQPLWVGSVKSNIGHAAAAAGVGRRDQDGDGAVPRAAAADVARRRALHPRRLVRRRGGAARRRAAVARQRPPAPRGRVLVWGERHQRARDPRGGAARRRFSASAPATTSDWSAAVDRVQSRRRPAVPGHATATVPRQLRAGCGRCGALAHGASGAGAASGCARRGSWAVARGPRGPRQWRDGRTYVVEGANGLPVHRPGRAAGGHGPGALRRAPGIHGGVRRGVLRVGPAFGGPAAGRDVR